METRFWSIVDRDGLTGLPSDMWAALDALVRDRAERQRVERNRDMWKGQCERQADKLRRIATLFDAIKHGDAEHQEWLRTAIEAHFTGEAA